MTDLLNELVRTVEDTVDVPLEFTRNLAGAFQDKLIAAFSKPVPSTDPMSAYRYLHGRRQLLQDSARQRPLVRMQDKNYNQLATIAQERSCRFEEIAADSGEAGVVIRGGDYLGDFVRNAVRIEEDLHLSIDPIGTQPDWKTRWGGKITNIDVKRDSSGIHTVELIATSNREHFKTTLVGSTPLFPPEVQPIKMWMLPANIRTACSITFFINLARLFFPPLSVPTNLFNPFGWINPLGPDALLNLDPLSWPIQCQFINPLLDQSRTSLLTAAWSNFHDVTVDPLRDAGCNGRIYTWFVEDETSPHPELELLVGKDLASLARPHRNCLIAAFEDHSGHEGPTGTVVDGPLNFIAKTLDDLITTTILPVDEDDDGEVDPVFQRLFGNAPKKPWAIYRDGQHSGIIESGYHQHKGPTKTTMTGGRSPKLVNDLQCVAADTVIEGPDGDERIDILAKRGTAFRVWSRTPSGACVPAMATHAFKKGRADLFEYVLQDGRSIKATHEHRFLTEAGWLRGGSILIGSRIATTNGRFTPVMDIAPLGVDDFYDMTVPGLENYAAQGIWNHNTFGIKYGLARLSEEIYTVSGLAVAGVEAPATPGLEEIYQGQLDNILFAWQRFTDPFRALATGDFAYQEWFEHPGSSAYTISAVLNLRLGNFKKRAFRSFKTSIRNGAPYIINYDILLNDRVGFEVDDILYVDQVSAIKFEYQRDKPTTYTVSVGDATQDADPFAQGIKALQAVYTIASMAAGEGWLFS